MTKRQRNTNAKRSPKAKTEENQKPVGGAVSGTAEAGLQDAGQSAGLGLASVETGATAGAADANGDDSQLAGHDLNGENDGAWSLPPAWDENVLAAAFAASHAFGPEGLGCFVGEKVDNDSSKLRPIMDKAAEFLRQWPDGTAEATAIHLRMKGFPDVPVPGPRELAAWKVFAFTLTTLDQVDAAEAAAKLAAEPAAPAPIYPGEQALRPEPGTFDPDGFSLRR